MFSELHRKHIARGEITVNDSRIPVVAEGDLAEELAKCRQGDRVHVSGSIVIHESDAKYRNAIPLLEISIEEIHECNRAPQILC